MKKYFNYKGENVLNQLKEEGLIQYIRKELEYYHIEAIQ